MAVKENTNATESLPELISASGDAASFAWEEFIYGRLRNLGTKRAYRHAVERFLGWCDQQGTELVRIAPAHVGRYLDGLSLSPATKKLHLSALAAEERHYAPDGIARIEKSETVHDGYYRVGTVCIVPDSDRSRIASAPVSDSLTS